MRKIVITGGPCAGKSRILEQMKANYGDRAIIIPEIATQVLSVPYTEGGVGIPGKDLEWSQEWQTAFQERVIFAQIMAEAEAEDQAREADDAVILCDRGILDGAAYFPGGKAELADKFMLSLPKCLASYDQVIHLSSLSTDQPDLYEKEKASNPCRFEDTARAQELDRNIAEAWCDHPSYSRIEATENIERKFERCLETINSDKTESMTEIGQEQLQSEPQETKQIS